MRRDRELERLRSVPLFENLSKREAREILGVAREIEYPEGREILRERLIGQDFYLILHGQARVTQRDGS